MLDMSTFVGKLNEELRDEGEGAWIEHHLNRVPNAIDRNLFH